MASEPQSPIDIEDSLASAFDLILPASYLHATRQVGDRFHALSPEEQMIAEGMKGHRRAEFTTARVLIRELLKVMKPMGEDHDRAVLPDSDGCALWPEGITGSISHTRGFCTVALGKQRTGSSLGIDIETRGRLSTEAKRKICSPEEQLRVEAFAPARHLSEQDVYTLIFSAKEAFFKYQFPRSRLWLEFQDVKMMQLDSDLVELHAPKLDSSELPALRHVFYRFTPGHVATAVWS